MWWIDASENREICSWTSTWFVHRAHGQIYRWWRWCGFCQRGRIIHVVIIQIILAPSEWSSAKDVGPINLPKMQHKTAINIPLCGDCLCLRHFKRLFSWERFIEKIYAPPKKQGTISQWKNFDKSAKLVSEQSDEMYGVKTINQEDSSWKCLSLVGDEEVISLLQTKVYVFSDSVLCFGKISENPQSNVVWEDKLTWFRSSSQYRLLDTIDGIFLQNAPHCSSATNQKISQDGLSSCWCATTSHRDEKKIVQECEPSAQFVFYAKRFSAGQ